MARRPVRTERARAGPPGLARVLFAAIALLVAIADAPEAAAANDSGPTSEAIASEAPLQDLVAQMRSALFDGDYARGRRVADAIGRQAGDAGADPHPDQARAFLALAEWRRRFGDHPAALAAARRALAAADRLSAPGLALQARVLLAALERGAGRLADADRALDAAGRLIGSTPEPSWVALLALERAALARASGRFEESLEHLRQAIAAARRAQARRLGSRAWGELAELQARHGAIDAAIEASRRAAFLAQQWPDLQYRWHWQLGRLLAGRGDVAGAIDAMRLAVEAAPPGAWFERPESAAATAGAGQGALHFALADLLLRQAATMASPQRKAAVLREARERIEATKAAELRDYFRDDCVTELKQRITPIDRLAPRTAAVYPILLADRTELLVSLPDGIRQIRVAVGRDEIGGMARRLRTALERRTSRAYLAPARALHRWLVAPIEALLSAAGIETLVWVPAGPLLTIPFGALHDGRSFLVERYALAITPGLQLTDARPMRRDRIRALVAGLSVAVGGFPPLANVVREIERVHALFGGTVLRDDDFRLARFGDLMDRDPYAIVHVASHAQFDADPSKAFVLAFDGRLGMSRLAEFVDAGRFRREPLELLTLSACQSAAGDERAALGLAGIAVRSGARSALASLWFVDDLVSTELITGFYRALRDDGLLSKAGALRRAQRALIGDRRYRHPGYWSPYLLIGNWQ
ncbi:MAG: CHAT domain-containing protein [Burkholderiaceae bacterium]